MKTHLYTSPIVVKKIMCLHIETYLKYICFSYNNLGLCSVLSLIEFYFQQIKKELKCPVHVYILIDMTIQGSEIVLSQ